MSKTKRQERLERRLVELVADTMATSGQAVEQIEAAYVHKEYRLLKMEDYEKTLEFHRNEYQFQRGRLEGLLEAAKVMGLPYERIIMEANKIRFGEGGE